jgi:[acyl-carrier-protein] S-malonyltransferase
MGRELYETSDTVKALYESADQILGFRISELAFEGPEEELNDTINTQPALLVHSISTLAVLKEQFPSLNFDFVAGHSMGELSALVAAGVLTFSDALQLARTRGTLMKRAGAISPGGMAAILGLDIQILESICAEASNAQEIVQVANDNCPGQVVISGNFEALTRAIALADQAGARKAKALAVSIAAHSPLMAIVQNEYSHAVRSAMMKDPTIPLIGNVDALPLTGVDQIQEDLIAQFTSRVRWTESIQQMRSDGVSVFIEIGSGSVLTGLLKRIDREALGIAVGNPADLEKLRLTFAA